MVVVVEDVSYASTVIHVLVLAAGLVAVIVGTGAERTLGSAVAITVAGSYTILIVIGAFIVFTVMHDLVLAAAGGLVAVYILAVVCIAYLGPILGPQLGLIIHRVTISLGVSANSQQADQHDRKCNLKLHHRVLLGFLS